MEMIANRPHPADSVSGETAAVNCVKGSRSLTVRGFSLAKGIGPGHHISSGIFSVGGYDWALYLYPDGKMEEDKSLFVSVFITMLSDVNYVKALFELKLLDQSGKENHKVHSHFISPPEYSPFTLRSKNSMWGYKKFFRRSNLESSDYIKDDCITLTCTVGVVKPRLEAPKQYRIAIPKPSTGHDLKFLLESGMGCDVCFTVGDEKFKAHKFILAARSPVFKTQFFELAGDANVAAVEISNVEPSVFKAMLQFIYSDSFPELHEVPGSTRTNMIQHLSEAAERYGLYRLKQLCEARLLDNINAHNLATTLSVAEQHQYSEQLEAVCLKLAAAGFLQPSESGNLQADQQFSSVQVCFPSSL